MQSDEHIFQMGGNHQLDYDDLNRCLVLVIGNIPKKFSIQGMTQPMHAWYL